MKKSKVLEQNDTQLLAGAFGMDNEEFNEEDEVQNNVDNVLQTINIISDIEQSKLTVILIFNENLVFNRYANKREKLFDEYNYKEMNQFS